MVLHMKQNSHRTLKRPINTLQNIRIKHDAMRGVDHHVSIYLITEYALYFTFDYKVDRTLFKEYPHLKC